MKKSLLFIFAFIMMLGIKVYGEEIYCDEGNLYDIPDMQISDEAVLMEFNSMEQEAAEKIADAWRRQDSVVSLSGYGITKSRLGKIISDALYGNPEIYYLNSSYYYYYYDYAGYVTTVEFKYRYSLSQVEEYDKVIEAERANVMALLDESMTDLEKLMVIHSYIVINFDYDYDYSVRDIYAFFTQRKGVCMAYTSAMAYLCNLRE